MPEKGGHEGSGRCCFWAFLPWHRHRDPFECHYDEHGNIWVDGKIEFADIETIKRFHENHIKAMG